MKETIHIQGREGDSNSKHFVEFTHLFYVLVALAKLN